MTYFPSIAFNFQQHFNTFKIYGKKCNCAKEYGAMAIISFYVHTIYKMCMQLKYPAFSLIITIKTWNTFQRSCWNETLIMSIDLKKSWKLSTLIPCNESSARQPHASSARWGKSCVEKTETILTWIHLHHCFDQGYDDRYVRWTDISCCGNDNSATSAGKISLTHISLRTDNIFFWGSSQYHNRLAGSSKEKKSIHPSPLFGM